MRKAFALLAALSVSACSTGIGALPDVNAPSRGAQVPAQRPVQRPAQPATPPPGAFRSAPVQNAAGLAGVIGERAGSLTRRFGKARIDLTEGDARKLQFLGSDCVLDVYLYPRSAGGEPVATHVEARTRSNGADTDRAACIRAVERQR
ncbi:MAG: hypothetical protein AAF291_10630 [Pseudomonadota bacterium]